MGGMRPEQLEDLVTLSAPTLHPDGAFAVVAVSHPSFAVDAEVGQLWRVPLDGGAPRRITRGFRDSAPKFSPDGTLLAFVPVSYTHPEPTRLGMISYAVFCLKKKKLKSEYY